MKGLNFFYRCSSVFTEPLQKEGKRWNFCVMEILSFMYLIILTSESGLGWSGKYIANIET